MGTPSRGGDVAVHGFDTNQPSLPSPVYSVLVSVSVCMALSSVFHFNCISFHKRSRQLSIFSLCSSGLNSAFFGPFNYIFLYKSLLQP